MTKQELAQQIDLTLLRPDNTKDEIKKLCIDANEYGFWSVCVPPYRVLDVVGFRDGIGGKFKICVVLDFPFNNGTTFYSPALLDIPFNVDEIDIPLHIAYFKDGNYDKAIYLMKEVKRWNKRVFVKGIIETSYLTELEIKTAAKLVEQAGVNMVKANTGFGPRGVSVSDISLIKDSCKLPIKAAGGIGTVEQAKSFLDLGVSRLGCSKGVEIVKEWEE